MTPFYKGEEKNVWDFVTERDGDTVTIATPTYEVFDSEGVSVQASDDASVLGNGATIAYIYGMAYTGVAGFVSGEIYKVKFSFSIGSEKYIIEHYIKID